MRKIHVDIEEGNSITCEDFNTYEDAKDFLEAMDDTSFERIWGIKN